MRKLSLLLFVFFIFNKTLFSAFDIAEDNLMFGVSGGKSIINGYYKDKLRDGYSFGFYANYSFFTYKFLLLESNFSYTELSLKNSNSSEFAFYCIGIGPVLYFPLWRYIEPYTGLFANLNYVELTAVKTNKSEKAFKPGIMIKAGLNIPVYSSVSADIGIRYSMNELSGKIYQNTVFFLGASYRLNFVTGETVQNVTRQIEINEVYETGLRYFRQGDGLKSKEFFNQVIKYDKSYKDVKDYLLIIEKNEHKYNKALELISENKLFEALPLLIDTAQYIIQARDKLTELRLKISDEEKKLERLGIDAYLQGDYEKCIFYMNRVQLINPENESAKLYLPRAIQRYNALKKFE